MKKINLALQGGGSHGAFTWGVLDRLLEDERIEIEGISGVSAGAMNAVMIAHGLLEGGREGARKTLNEYWQRVAIKDPFKDFHKNLLKNIKNIGKGESPLSLVGKMVSRGSSLLSPPNIKEIDLNPLDTIVRDMVNFDRIRKESSIKLFVGATHVKTGKLKLFKAQELTADMLMASACLPSPLSKGVEIDGEIYWDGGYSANPAIFPLIYQCDGDDIITVLLHPLLRKEAPNSTNEIINRIAELTFSNTFLREMRAITASKQEIKGVSIFTDDFEKRMAKSLFHHIEAEELMNELSATSKMNNHESFLKMLKEHGRSRAELFLIKNFNNIGDRCSVDLKALFV